MNLNEIESFQFEKCIIVSAPINIALVKYWGKEDEEKIIPKNNSISLTLHKDEFKSTTLLRISTNIENHAVIINDKKSNVTKRMINMFENAMKKSDIPLCYHEKLKFEIFSQNNFPTAAGMASSASGMASLAFGFGKIFLLSMEDVSILARLGSGSATRSVYGGIVEWIKGSGDNSRAVQLYDEKYWPDLQVLICVVNGSEKKVTSTAGMQATVSSSQLSKYRYTHSVEENLAELRKALMTRNFSQLAEITMRESNQLHAICLDTNPPLIYLNPESFDIIEFVKIVNQVCKENKLAYTFDAGPNAFLIFEKDFQSTLYSLLRYSFDIDIGVSRENVNTLVNARDDNDDHDGLRVFYEKLPKHPAGIIKYCISTKIGSGPEVIHAIAI